MFIAIYIMYIYIYLCIYIYVSMYIYICIYICIHCLLVKSSQYSLQSVGSGQSSDPARSGISNEPTRVTTGDPPRLEGLPGLVYFGYGLAG